MTPFLIFLCWLLAVGIIAAMLARASARLALRRERDRRRKLYQAARRVVFARPGSPEHKRARAELAIVVAADLAAQQEAER